MLLLRNGLINLWFLFIQNDIKDSLVCCNKKLSIFFYLGLSLIILLIVFTGTIDLCTYGSQSMILKCHKGVT